MAHKTKSCFFISLHLYPFTCVLVQIDKLIYFSKYKVKVSFFKIFFLRGSFLKSLLTLIQYCLFYFWLFGLKACWILAPPPGTKPTTCTLAGQVLNTGLPGKSQHLFKTLTSKPKLQVGDIGNLWSEDLGQSSKAMWWDSQGTFQPFAMS